MSFLLFGFLLFGVGGKVADVSSNLFVRSSLPTLHIPWWEVRWKGFYLCLNPTPRRECWAQSSADRRVKTKWLRFLVHSYTVYLRVVSQSFGTIFCCSLSAVTIIFSSNLLQEVAEGGMGHAKRQWRCGSWQQDALPVNIHARAKARFRQQGLILDTAWAGI